MTVPARVTVPTPTSILEINDVAPSEDQYGERFQDAQAKLEQEKFFRKRQQHRRMKQQILRGPKSGSKPRDSR